MAPIPPLYLISVCYCLRASASRHKKMKESTFLPTSALWNQQMSQISQRGSTVPGRVGQQPTQPKKADKSANRSESASFGTISQEDGHIRPPLTSRTTGFPIEAYFADGSKTHRPPSVSTGSRNRRKPSAKKLNGPSICYRSVGHIAQALGRLRSIGRSKTSWTEMAKREPRRIKLRLPIVYPRQKQPGAVLSVIGQTEAPMSLDRYVRATLAAAVTGRSAGSRST